MQGKWCSRTSTFEEAIYAGKAQPTSHQVHGCFNDSAFVIQPADLICVPKILTSSSTVTTTLIFLKHFFGFSALVLKFPSTQCISPAHYTWLKILRTVLHIRTVYLRTMIMKIKNTGLVQFLMPAQTWVHMYTLPILDMLRVWGGRLHHFRDHIIRHNLPYKYWHL